MVKTNIKYHERVAELQLDGRLMGGQDYDTISSGVRTIMANGYVDLIFNLNGIKWINHTGLGTLVNVSHDLKKLNGRTKICCPTDRVNEILTVTQLKSVFETYDTLDDALKSYEES
ncbi:STAS domain-containing protein [archaeon]|nr:STAS domain-containing protein [archaeon]